MKYSVSTCDEVLSKGTCDSVYLPSVTGRWGVLPGHTRQISLLKKGLITIWRDGQEMDFPCEQGFVKVDAERIDIILTS